MIGHCIYPAFRHGGNREYGRKQTIENETALIDKEMLDSFDIISIVSEINEAFDISINVNDLLPENFNSVDAILALIAKLQEE